jgi:hypothetical protein
MSRSLGRQLLAFVAATVLVASGMAMGAGQALANADCDQMNRLADIELTQTLTLTGYAPNGDWLLSKHAISENRGPCNIHEVTFTDLLPPTATLIPPVTTNPAGWTCSSTASSVTCVSTASVGVPGFTDFYINYSMPPVTDPNANVTDAASVAVSGDVTDPDLANNAAFAGVVGAFGGTVTTGSPTGSQNCANPFCQFEQIKMPGVASPRAVSIQELNSPCTATGIGRCVAMDSGTTADWQYKTFIINLAAVTAAGVSYGAVSLVHSDDLANFTDVPMCSRGQPDLDPCIVEFTKFKVGGATFLKIVARTKNDDGWGIDG